MSGNFSVDRPWSCVGILTGRCSVVMEPMVQVKNMCQLLIEGDSFAGSRSGVMMSEIEMLPCDALLYWRRWRRVGSTPAITSQEYGKQGRTLPISSTLYVTAKVTQFHSYLGHPTFKIFVGDNRCFKRKDRGQAFIFRTSTTCTPLLH